MAQEEKGRDGGNGGVENKREIKSGKMPKFVAGSWFVIHVCNISTGRC